MQNRATANIGLEGPNGVGLGIRVLENKKKLFLRSSVDRKTLQQMEHAMRDHLDLTLIKIEEDPELKTDTEKTWLERSSALLVAGIAGTVSIGVALLGSSGLPALKSTLRITAPVINEKNVAQIESPSVPIRWSMVRKSLWRGERAEEVRAIVIVEGDENPAYRKSVPNAAAGEYITFPQAGIYYVTVAPGPETGVENATILVKVLETPAVKAASGERANAATSGKNAP